VNDITRAASHHILMSELERNKKMKKMYTGKIPFRNYEEIVRDGELVRKAHRRQLEYDGYPEIIWKDNQVFRAKIQIISYSRGRSAANWSATLSEVDNCEAEYAEFLEGVEVNIFMTDMLHIILNNNLFCGKSVFLRLAFVKRGANYGLCMVEE